MMAFWKLDVAFAASPASIEQIALRWMHIVAAIIWLGFLFFFVLAVAPTLKALDPAIRAKVFPEIASRGLWWLRWSALVAWLAGFRYFMILAKTDAVNAGRPHAWGAWIGIWLACWLAAFAIEMALLRAGGPLGNPFVAGTLVFFVVAAVSWLVVSLLAQPGAGNRTLCISIGGGLGTILFLNVWGIAWRCQKRLIAWTRAASEHKRLGIFQRYIPEVSAALGSILGTPKEKIEKAFNSALPNFVKMAEESNGNGSGGPGGSGPAEVPPPPPSMPPPADSEPAPLPAPRAAAKGKKKRADQLSLL